MASVNKVILIGNLGKDPDLNNTAAGNPVCNFSLATTESWTGKDGQKQEKTEWHRVVVWGKPAEACFKFLRKGSAAYVEGRIQSREYTDKEGQKRTAFEIVAERVQFLGGKGGESSSAPAPSSTPPPASSSSKGGGFSDDEIPF